MVYLAFNDVPEMMNVSLLDNDYNPLAVHGTVYSLRSKMSWVQHEKDRTTLSFVCQQQAKEFDWLVVIRYHLNELQQPKNLLHSSQREVIRTGCLYRHKYDSLKLIIYHFWYAHLMHIQWLKVSSKQCHLYPQLLSEFWSSI